MAPVTYRDYDPQDAGDVKAIIDEAFFIHRYVNGTRLHASVLEVYLRDCLLSSSYAHVAVRDDRVIGVLMGRVSGEARLSGAIGNSLRMAGHMLTLAVLGFRQRRSLRSFFAFTRVYRSLRRQSTTPLTDEVTLFAVASAARGLGAGKALYAAFLEHLRERGRTSFCLFTDTLCTYGFYDKHGMTRAASQDLTVYLDGEPEVVGVYLYTGTVD